MIHGGVLCVDVVDGIAESLDSRDHVNTLPEKMARIQIRANRLAHGVSESQQRLGIKYYAIRHHLNTHPYATISSYFRCFFPIRDHPLFPLPFPRGEKILLWKRTYNPTREAGSGFTTWTAAKRIDFSHIEQPRQ